MTQFLYEKSVSDRGHLIVPFVQETVVGQPIYSYRLLSELGHKGKFHQSTNPADIYSGNLLKLIDAAKQHLAEHSDIKSNSEHFKSRYTYRHNLIIIYQAADKYFYDHYPPTRLDNIAAPRLFKTEQECILWVKRGLDRNYVKPVNL
jgi:hypothetical protein